MSAAKDGREAGKLLDLPDELFEVRAIAAEQAVSEHGRDPDRERIWLDVLALLDSVLYRAPTQDEVIQ